MTIINPCVTGTIDQNGAFTPYTYYIGDTDTHSFSTLFTSTSITSYSSCSKKYKIYSDAALTTEITATTYFSINSNTGVVTIYNNDVT